MITKAIILLAGTGSRLRPSTLSINKHLLPIYDKPMFFYPLSLLMLANIKDFLFVVNKGEIGTFKNIIKNPRDLGISITYIEQTEPGGIPQAISLGEEYTNKKNFLVILGDNFFYGSNLPELIFKNLKKNNILTFTYPTKNPSQFGILELNKKGKIKTLSEKPKNPKSNLAITGMYAFDNNFFKYSKKLKRSERNEFEITDILNIYKKKIKNIKLGRGDVWFDLGTYNDFNKASIFIKNIEQRQLLKIACLEEIAFLKKWINKRNIKNRIQDYKNSDYSNYLKDIIRW